LLLAEKVFFDSMGHRSVLPYLKPWVIIFRRMNAI
jgi:hypothetical protein